MPFTFRKEYFRPLHDAALRLLSDAERLDREADDLKRKAAQLREHYNSVRMAWERLSDGDPLRGVPPE